MFPEDFMELMKHTAHVGELKFTQTEFIKNKMIMDREKEIMLCYERRVPFSLWSPF